MEAALDGRHAGVEDLRDLLEAIGQDVFQDHATALEGGEPGAVREAPLGQLCRFERRLFDADGQFAVQRLAEAHVVAP